MKVLIVDDVAPSLVRGLMDFGYQVDYLPFIKRVEMLNTIQNYNILVIRTKTPIDVEVLEKATNLKIIARAGSGMDNIDLELAISKNILCLNAAEANADAVGEHTLAVLLNLLRKINIANNEVKNKIWSRESNRGIELNGKTVGIIGFGNTGKAFAKKLAGFDCKVLAYDKFLTNYGNQHAQEASLDDIHENAEILSLHIPLTLETKNWINGNFLQKMKKNIFFLNMSRGEVVNTSELVNNIENGRVIGAGLDVLENENINHLSNQQQTELDYLIKSEKVVLTPHIAGWTFESYEKIAQVILLKLTNLK